MRSEPRQRVVADKEERGGMGEWPKLRFSDAVLINPPVHLKRGKSYPFVAKAAVHAGSRCAYAGEQRAYSGGGTRFRSGDTLMARITPCLENGKIARYCAPHSSDTAHGSTEFIVLRGRPAVTDSEFVYYLTQWEEVRHYAIGQMTGTSGRQRVPTPSLAHLTVTIPPLPDQRAIAYLLGTLDAKIEVNRRMNATLDEMARALFTSWFVHFDPVQAKAALTQRASPGGSAGPVARAYLDRLEPALAALFPDRFVDSALGPIPAGWAVKPLGECFNLTMGQSPPGSTYNEHGEGLPFFQGRADFGFRYPTNRKYCAATTRFAEPDDTLVSVRAPVGDINLAWGRSCIGRGIAALRHQSGSSSFTYHSVWAMQQELRQYEDTGTVFGAITKNQFETLMTLEPNRAVIDGFHSIAGEIDARIRANVYESRTLAALRDTLLPKLLSGDIRVPDAAEQVERLA